MPIEMGLWRIDGSKPIRLEPEMMPTEAQLESFLADDPSLLGEPLLIIGRQVRTGHGKLIDLLAIEREGGLHILELKRDKTPRDVVAQILDYGSWAAQLDHEQVLTIAGNHFTGSSFEAAFEEAFGGSPPDELNLTQSLTIIAADLDAGSERIVSYLNKQFGVPINVVFFRYYTDDGRQYLARSWLFAVDETAQVDGASRTVKKQAPWNGVDWYVSFGHGDNRDWEDARRYGFISAGGGRWYSDTLKKLPVGARVFVRVPQVGYVGVGTTTGLAKPFDEATVDREGNSVLLRDQELHSAYRHAETEAQDANEYIVPVSWIKTLPLSQAIHKKGLFGNQNSACKLRQEFTLDYLDQAFALSD
jgi:hypothetical protein